MSILFIDTDAELWYGEAEKLGVNVIKMPYVLNGEEIFDDVGKTRDYKQFYAAIRAGGSAKTAALNVHDYIQYFQPYFEKGEEILYIAFSSKLSATFDFLNVAIAELSQKYPKAKFTRFDTKNISMGAGFMCYYGAKLWKEGKSVEKIVEFLTSIREHVNCTFIVDDLDHLKKGGRISPAVAFAGKMLGVKPVLTVLEDGSLTKVGTVKGSKNVVGFMADLVINNCADYTNYDIWVMHADVEDKALQIKELITAKFPSAKLHLQIIGPVVGCHCGPGCLGIIFYQHSK